MTMHITNPSVIPSARNLDPSQRMKVLDAINKFAGWTAPQTIYPEGTALIDVGEENLRRVRAEVDSLKTLGDFVSAFRLTEAQRRKEDVPASAGDLRMNAEGFIARKLPDGTWGKRVGYTPTGLNQLVSLHADAIGLPRGFAGSLAWLSPKARAEAFNDLAIRYGERQKEARLPDRVFRLADDKYGQTYLRAVTSTQHTGLRGGALALVERLVETLPERDLSTVKVRVETSEDRFSLELISPMMKREIRVGDVLWGEQVFTLSETKATSASVRAGVMRVLCVNLTRRPYGQEKSFGRRHVGNGFLDDVMREYREGRVKLEPFIQAFGDSYEVPLEGTPAELADRAVKALELPMGAESIVNAWAMDGSRSAGMTMGGLVNALTRASQDLPVADAEEVEVAAGKLVDEGLKALGLV
jgi:hypothetical protein